MEIRRLIDEVGLSFADCVRIATGTGTAPSPAGAKNWAAVAEAFLATREGLRPSTLRDLRTRMRRALTTLGSNLKPRDGRELMRDYSRQHFSA